jgi:CHAT domain-containing protein/Tfp pilus assembly protein PilF
MLQSWKRIVVLGLLLVAGLSVSGFLAAPQSPSPHISPLQPSPGPQAKAKPMMVVDQRFDLLKEAGKPRTLVSGLRHLYRIDLRAGQLLSAVVQQKGVDVQLQVVDPGRELLLLVDTPNGNDGPEDVLFIASKIGAYWLIVSTEDEPGTGASYVIQEVERRTATRRDRKRVLALQGYHRAKSLMRVAEPNLKAAATAFLSSAQALREVGNRDLEAYAWAKLARIYGDQGQWRDAVAADKGAAALFRRLGKGRDEIDALSHMAEGEQKSGNIDQARKLYMQVRDLSHGLRYESAEASALTNLGQIQAERVETWEGSRSLQDALAIWRTLKSRDGEARTLGAFGLLYFQAGQFPRALASYQEALRVPPVSSGVRALLLTQMGNTYIYAGRADRAFGCFQQAFDIQRGSLDLVNQASTLVGFGLAYVQSGNYKDALDPYQRALKVYQSRGDLRGVSTTLTNIGWALSELARYEEARNSFNQALQLARRLKNPNLETAVRLGFAWMERRRNNLSEARRQAEQALKLVEFLRREADDPETRIAFFSGKQDIYELLINVLMRQYELQGSRDLIAKALQISESAHARNLLDNLDGNGGRIATSILASQEIQKRVLDPDTILLEYSLGGSKSYLWMMTQESLEAFPLPGRKELEALAMDTYARLAKSHLPEEQAGAIEKTRELSRVLLGPVAGRLGSKRLLIVPSGALQYIPFAALLDPDAPIPRTLPEGKWPPTLALHHEIVYEPSASVLAEIRRTRKDRQPAPKLLAALADGVFELDDPRILQMPPAQIRVGSDPVLGYLGRLQASGQEVESIAAALPPGQVKKALGFGATRDLVVSGELGEYRIVHIATHTFFQSQRAGSASIILSRYDEKGRARNGFLRIKDINALSFDSDLVVLSSCNSGLGEDIPGEGLVGFPQAFLAAGSSGVVMSVWRVQDTSTAKLMDLFYRNIFIRHMSSSAALQEAQIAMWRDPQYNAPWFWAGFIAQGEWNRIPIYLNKTPPGVSSRNGDQRSPSMTTKSSLSISPH